MIPKIICLSRFVCGTLYGSLVSHSLANDRLSYSTGLFNILIVVQFHEDLQVVFSLLQVRGLSDPSTGRWSGCEV